MILSLKKHQGKTIGLEWLAKAGIIDEDDWRYNETTELNLSSLPAKKLGLLATRLEEVGLKTQGADVRRWLLALKDTKIVRPRTVRQFYSLLLAYIHTIPGHRVYQTTPSLFAYYVSDVKYQPPRRNRDGTTDPAHVYMRYAYRELGSSHTSSETFYADDCLGITVPEALGRKELIAETEDLRATYLEHQKKYHEVIEKIGAQYLAVGVATDNMDGNTTREKSWYWNHSHDLPMERNGEPSRVVIDVFYEDPKEAHRSERDFSDDFWVRYASGRLEKSRDEEAEEFSEMEAAELTETETDDHDVKAERGPVEIPVHPMCAVFDLKKHLRLRIHVEHLTAVVYEDTIADKLVIADWTKDLVKVLIRHRAGKFKDIIGGKAGGAVVMLSGPPGTGKTLTAEVYAEAEHKALYSVQCSQLGVTPEDLEESLLRVFARANRWGAVLLLDEADVYVKTRGGDLTQNAIVGVFLRVLEYQDTVLFLTTNRPDDVDDAIASRCIARISYAVPTGEEQARIWRVLADQSSLNLTPKAISEIVQKNPAISGRDVKQLLKLSGLVAEGKPITPDIVENVKRFRP